MTLRVFLVLISILKWYLYYYTIYFGFILILSSFTLRLGFSQCFVNLISKTLQLVENSSKKLEQTCKIISDAETNIRDEIHCRSDESNNNGTVIELRNDSVKTCNTINYMSRSSTIERDLILLPEMRVDLNSYVQNINDNVDNDAGRSNNSNTDEDENTSDDYNFNNNNNNNNGNNYKLQTSQLFDEYSRNVYNLLDIMSYMRAGMEAIVEDQITCTFEAEKLHSWNLLTRNNPHLHFYNWKIMIIWLIGLLFRYLIMFPIRFLNCILGLSLLFVSMTALNYLSDSHLKKLLYRRMTLMCFHLLTRWLGFVPKFHNSKNKPKNGIAVSNHTTPFDVLILNMDNCYSLTGQKHRGFIGFLERLLDQASPHIWFDRTLITDREGVSRRLREHVNKPQNPPILIFPEGTCINNTAVVQFKKGAFQVGTTIYPIAIKYDNRFGNAFWNSEKQSALQHVLEMMTSWSIVCNIWYLPPMKRNENETAVDFANRVKQKIAGTINVINLTWDGQVKRRKPKPEWKEVHRRLFFEKLKSRLHTS